MLAALVDVDENDVIIDMKLSGGGSLMHLIRSMSSSQFMKGSSLSLDSLD